MKYLVTASAVVAIFVGVAIIAISVRSTMHPATMASYGPFNSLLLFRKPNSSVITKGRAIHAAVGSQRRYWKSPMKVTAAYGLFSDNTMCTQKTNTSKCVLDYQRFPAWVVTATGPDACILGSGGPGRLIGAPPRPRPTLTPAQAATCQMNYVIDARTGKQIEGFN